MINKLWVLAALVMLTLVVTGLVGAVVMTADSLDVAIGRAGIITSAAAGPVGVLILMLQVKDVQQKVNGHLEAHIGHTDEQVRSLVDDRVRELAGPAQTSVRAPEGPGTT